MRAVCDRLSDSYATYYSLTDHLAVNEIIVLFTGRVIFKQYIPKKHKQFWKKLYKLCDSKLYTYKMTVYACRDGKRGTQVVLGQYLFISIG
jgi:hypothetical protein